MPETNNDSKQERQDKRQISGAISIVRISGKDVDGSLSIRRAVGKIKGIGSSMASALCIVINDKLKIDPSATIGSLNDDQIESVEKIIKDPLGNGIPWYLLNKNKDMETGSNIHIVSNDLVYSTRQDISRHINVGTWRGFRHQYGQKVRGQHTRSTGRTGATVGVTKKAATPGTAGAAAGAKPDTKSAIAPKKK